MISAATPLVFLHIPKTAGQTVHGALAGLVGAQAVSPVRVHSQAAPGAAQVPPGYSLYSGHIDWEALEALPPGRRVFTILRDPLERIASFYFYLRRQARALPEADLALPARRGLRMARDVPAETYFFGGDPVWRRFVAEHYRNPYCAYLVTRRLRGWGALGHLPPRVILARAEAAARGLDGVYSVDTLDRLERDLLRWTGARVVLAGRYVNAGPGAGAPARSDLPRDPGAAAGVGPSTPAPSGPTMPARWPALAAELSPAAATRLARWVALDRALMARLGLAAVSRSADRIGAAA